MIWLSSRVGLNCQAVSVDMGFELECLRGRLPLIVPVIQEGPS